MDFPTTEETQKSLLQKEHDLNLAEQNLIRKRILALKEKMKIIGKDDPEYGLSQMEIDKDEIFLDELIVREEELQRQLEQS